MHLNWRLTYFICLAFAVLNFASRLASANTPPEKLNLGLSTLGARQPVWTIKESIKATITVPPKPTNVEAELKELRLLKQFLVAYKDNAADLKNVKQRDTFQKFVTKLIPIVQKFNESFHDWPQISIASSVPLIATDCQSCLKCQTLSRP